MEYTAVLLAYIVAASSRIVTLNYNVKPTWRKPTVMWLLMGEATCDLAQQTVPFPKLEELKVETCEDAIPIWPSLKVLRVVSAPWPFRFIVQVPEPPKATLITKARDSNVCRRLSQCGRTPGKQLAS